MGYYTNDNGEVKTIKWLQNARDEYRKNLNILLNEKSKELGLKNILMGDDELIYLGEYEQLFINLMNDILYLFKFQLLRFDNYPRNFSSFRNLKF